MNEFKFMLWVFCFLTFSFIFKVEAQNNDSLFYNESKIDSSQVGSLSLKIENLNFFRNLEYKAELSKGYTLPGFRLSPIFVYQPLSKAKFELGIHCLRYWGAHVYPSLAYEDLPTWQADHYQKGFHYLPHLRAQVRLFDGGNLVLGSIYGGANHKLVEPLYNKDINLIADPEAGAQFLLDLPHFKSDVWVDWQTFIFRTDTHREVFSFGWASHWLLKLKDRVIFSIPIQVLAQHRGGELDVAQKDLYTFLNYAGGVDIHYNIRDEIFKNLEFKIIYAGFSELHGENLFFDRGGGVFSALSALTRYGRFKVAYWNANHYFSVYGSPLFGIKSDAIFGMYLKHAEFFYVGWNIQRKLGEDVFIGCDLDWHYLPSSYSVQKDGWSMKHKGGVNWGIGIYLKFSPTWLLKSFN